MRKQLFRKGSLLRTIRIRDPHAYNYGGYMVVEMDTYTIVKGVRPFPFSLSLDDVETLLES